MNFVLDVLDAAKAWGYEQNQFNLAQHSLVNKTRALKLCRHGDPGIFFSRDHGIIEIGPEFLERKGNVMHVVQPTVHSTFGV